MYDPGQKECLLVYNSDRCKQKMPLSSLFEYLIRHSQLRVSSAKSGAVAIGLAKAGLLAGSTLNEVHLIEVHLISLVR